MRTGLNSRASSLNTGFVGQGRLTSLESKHGKVCVLKSVYLDLRPKYAPVPSVLHRHSLNSKSSISLEDIRIIGGSFWLSHVSSDVYDSLVKVLRLSVSERNQSAFFQVNSFIPGVHLSLHRNRT